MTDFQANFKDINKRDHSDYLLKICTISPTIFVKGTFKCNILS